MNKTLITAQAIAIGLITILFILEALLDSSLIILVCYTLIITYIAVQMRKEFTKQ